MARWYAKMRIALMRVREVALVESDRRYYVLHVIYLLS